MVPMPPAASSGRGAAMLRERYMWSVMPSLAVWPAMMMETGPGAFCVALVLVRKGCTGACGLWWFIQSSIPLHVVHESYMP